MIIRWFISDWTSKHEGKRSHHVLLMCVLNLAHVVFWSLDKVVINCCQFTAVASLETSRK